jgi:VanZ family protein
VLGGALVFCLRLAQVFLPGRSAEITDLVLLLLLAGLIDRVSAPTKVPVPATP